MRVMKAHRKLTIVLWCAWVLWAPTGVGNKEGWIPVDGYDTKQSCMVEQRDLTKTLARHLRGVPGLETAMVMLPKCLPDTVDPRGPKS